MKKTMKDSDVSCTNKSIPSPASGEMKVSATMFKCKQFSKFLSVVYAICILNAIGLQIPLTYFSIYCHN